jgi:hypothetical protein
MSNSRASDLHDPKYGKVYDLCRNLGYASDRKGTIRSTFYLSAKVTKFRKDFVKTKKLNRFPLDYQDPNAKSCASMFLIENPDFFKDTPQAEAFRWPVFPRDESVYAYDPIFDQMLTEILA